MLRSRVTRAFALLVLVVAQGVLALPHRAMAEGAMAQATMATSPAQANCHPGMPEQGAVPAHQQVPTHQPAPMYEQAPTHQPVPTHSCGCCQGSMPASHAGSCMVMASCGPTMATPAAPVLATSATVATADLAPALSAPPAHDFIPDPPPPRA